MLIDLDTFLALSPSSPVYSSLDKKGREGGRGGREEGKKEKGIKMLPQRLVTK